MPRQVCAFTSVFKITGIKITMGQFFYCNAIFAAQYCNRGIFSCHGMSSSRSLVGPSVCRSVCPSVCLSVQLCEKVTFRVLKRN